MSDKYIEIKNVDVFYPAQGGNFGVSGSKPLVKAVNGISLSMEKGEILGLIGESGCGKSTLGRVLTGLEEVTHGEILLDGENITELQKHDFRAFYRKVQIIFQNPFDTFNPKHRIERIMMSPLKNQKIGTNDAERRQMCLDALHAGGLRPADEIIMRYPHELSGGQLQRISILRSMLLDPGFIVADEPVSMLDVSVRTEIIHMLLEMSREKNTSVVFISHDIALTRYISDNVAVMYLGRIVEYGPTDTIIRNPQHPYTKALISNCASADLDEEHDPIPITGEPPTPINPGPGCFFAGRCPYATEQCIKEYPPEKELDDKRKVSCWNV